MECLQIRFKADDTSLLSSEVGSRLDSRRIARVPRRGPPIQWGDRDAAILRISRQHGAGRTPDSRGERHRVDNPIQSVSVLGAGRDAGEKIPSSRPHIGKQS